MRCDQASTQRMEDRRKMLVTCIVAFGGFCAAVLGYRKGHGTRPASGEKGEDWWRKKRSNILVCRRDRRVASGRAVSVAHAARRSASSATVAVTPAAQSRLNEARGHRQVSKENVGAVSADNFVAGYYIDKKKAT